MSFFNLDKYILIARVAPVLLTVLPTLIGVNLWAINTFSVPLNSVMILVLFAVFVFIAQFGRHRGKIKEPELWDSWGGPPTTRFLRHSDTQFNPIRRRRCHRNLQIIIPDLELPTPEEENNNPELADQIYEACTRYLIDKTRDQSSFPLIFKENINYGFLRNLWGLKPYGIFLTLLGLVIAIFHASYQWLQLNTISVYTLFVTAINFIFLFLWFFWVTPQTIKVAADAYAERLLEYCEQLNESQFGSSQDDINSD